MNIKEQTDKFYSLFGNGEAPEVFFAPGRVNLIGEHTDYNGGHVFPCALSLGTWGLVRKRNDRILQFYSENIPDDGIVTSNLDDLTPASGGSWTNYPKGVIWSFFKAGYTLDTGMDVLFYGTLPSGAGLSSSASIEVLTAIIIKHLYHFDTLSMEKLSVMSQYAENRFIGTNCGIMDPFACALGKKDHGIFLDTNRLDYEYVPLALGTDVRIVITDSKVKHSLMDSSYNDRRKECEKGLAMLQKMIDINNLGELTNEQFERYKILISDETIQKRVKHAVSENRRTVHALQALKENDINEFGRLMNKSHLSLRDDFEVSCEEIDLLVKTAWELPGVIGSRITGGGFGGSTVSLVKLRNLNLFKNKLTAVYKKTFGIEPAFYVVETDDGARKID